MSSLTILLSISLCIPYRNRQVYFWCWDRESLCLQMLPNTAGQTPWQSSQKQAIQTLKKKKCLYSWHFALIMVECMLPEEENVASLWRTIVNIDARIAALREASLPSWKPRVRCLEWTFLECDGFNRHNTLLFIALWQSKLFFIWGPLEFCLVYVVFLCEPVRASNGETMRHKFSLALHWSRRHGEIKPYVT